MRATGSKIAAEGRGPVPTTTRPEHGRRPRAGAAGGSEQPAPSVNRAQLFTAESGDARLARQQRRAEKFQLRSDLRRFAKRKAVQLCGSRVCSSSGVGVRVTETASGRRAGFAGLSTCGSPWVCPVCASKVSASRAEDLSTVLNNVRAAGYDLAMVTLTVRHSAQDSLRDVWSAVSRGWGRVTSGKAWLDDKRRFEIPGWVKAVEVTHGKNGWHVHLHSVIAYRGTPADATALGQRIFGRWQAGLKATKKHKGFTALPGYGVDVSVSEQGDLGNLGRYLSKQGADLSGVSREVTQGAQKVARGGNRTPFQIARDLVAHGTAVDRAIFAEWQDVAPGHRQVSWAKGLREQFGVEVEATDEEIAAEETGTVDDTVCVLPAEEWQKVKHRSWELLDVAETRGSAGLLKWLDSWGVGWRPAPKRAEISR